MISCYDCACFDGKYCIRWYEDTLNRERGYEVITEIKNTEKEKCEDFIENETD